MAVTFYFSHYHSIGEYKELIAEKLKDVVYIGMLFCKCWLNFGWPLLIVNRLEH